ncbi:hypothetical protein PM082_023142 [Marasmius tenuissimus]|nr:hypothetical protein PM082_023142 [Marasmius tenuissimus]
MKTWASTQNQAAPRTPAQPTPLAQQLFSLSPLTPLASSPAGPPMGTLCQSPDSISDEPPLPFTEPTPPPDAEPSDQEYRQVISRSYCSIVNHAANNQGRILMWDDKQCETYEWNWPAEVVNGTVTPVVSSKLQDYLATNDIALGVCRDNVPMKIIKVSPKNPKSWVANRYHLICNEDLDCLDRCKAFYNLTHILGKYREQMVFGVYGPRGPDGRRTVVQHRAGDWFSGHPAVVLQPPQPSGVGPSAPMAAPSTPVIVPRCSAAASPRTLIPSPRTSVAGYSTPVAGPSTFATGLTTPKPPANPRSPSTSPAVGLTTPSSRIPTRPQPTPIAIARAQILLAQSASKPSTLAPSSRPSPPPYRMQEPNDTIDLTNNGSDSDSAVPLLLPSSQPRIHARDGAVPSWSRGTAPSPIDVIELTDSSDSDKLPVSPFTKHALSRGATGPKGKKATPASSTPTKRKLGPSTGSKKDMPLTKKARSDPSGGASTASTKGKQKAKPPVGYVNKRGANVSSQMVIGLLESHLDSSTVAHRGFSFEEWTSFKNRFNLCSKCLRFFYEPEGIQHICV